jgi:hypothetical protein
MMAHVMIARCAPAPSSPAQARAATRLRGYDCPTRPSQQACRSINAPLSTSPPLHNKRSDYTILGKGLTPALPERGPDAGTMDQVIVSRRRESVVLNER